MRRIISDPDILGGKPVVEGARLSVEHILGLLSEGMFHTDIVEAYPELTIEDITGVLQYAAEALYNDVVVEVKTTKGG